MRIARTVVAVAVTATIALAAQPSYADPAGGDKPINPPAGETSNDPVPPGFASWDEVLAGQRELNTVATRLREIAQRWPGYAGLSVPTEQRRVVLRWQGVPPEEILVAVERERGVASIEPAGYNERDLLTAIDQVLAAAAAEQHEVRVTAADPLADASGIRVAVDGPIAVAQSLVQGATTVPAIVEPGDSTPAYDRLADIPAYWAGARWHTWAGSCTTAFGVHRIQDGHRYLLSAGHCADDEDAAYTGANVFMGNVVSDDDMHDTLLIDAHSGSAMYLGPYTTSDSAPVSVNAMASFPGNYVCASGSYSGTTCYSKVISTGGTINIGYPVKPVVRAEQISHTAAVGNGDSGGPVYFGGPYTEPYMPSTFVKNAMGTITAIDLFTSVPCEGVPAGNGRSCAWRWWYVDITGPLGYYGLALN